MVILLGGAVAYERGNPVLRWSRTCLTSSFLEAGGAGHGDQRLAFALQEAPGGNLGRIARGFMSRATPLGRSRYQTSEFPSASEFPTESPTQKGANGGFGG